MESVTHAQRPETVLVDLAIESWRFQRLFGRALEKLDAAESGRFANQHRYFLRRIEECLSIVGMKLVSLEGQPYTTGAAVMALNIGDYEPDDLLVVDQMIEPIVMNSEGVARPGRVLLRKIDQ